MSSLTVTDAHEMADLESGPGLGTPHRDVEPQTPNQALEGFVAIQYIRYLDYNKSEVEGWATASVRVAYDLLEHTQYTKGYNFVEFQGEIRELPDRLSWEIVKSKIRENRGMEIAVVEVFKKPASQLHQVVRVCAIVIGYLLSVLCLVYEFTGAVAPLEKVAALLIGAVISPLTIALHDGRRFQGRSIASNALALFAVQALS